MTARDPFAAFEGAAGGWERRARSGLTTGRSIARLWVALAGWLAVCGIVLLAGVLLAGR